METNSPTLESELLSGVYSDEEKADILARIEQAAAANRLDQTEVFRPRKRGVFFPVLVNLLAAALIVGAWFAADSWFKLRQQSLHLKTDQLFSTESKLIAKVLEDARAQVKAKDAEISRIQSDLERAASETAQLQKTFDSRVAAQEALLKDEMNKALDEERQRLRDSGLSEAEVQRRLQTFAAQKAAEFNQQLTDFRKQAQAQLDQRNQEYAALQAQLDQTKAQQDALRQQIAAQTQAREKDLQGQVSAQASSLQKLSQEREDLNLFFGTVDTAMQDVKRTIGARDWKASQPALDRLKAVLEQGTKQATEAVRQRAQAGLDEEELLASTVAAVQAGGGATSKDVAALQAELDRQKAAALDTKTSLEAALKDAETQSQDAQAKVAELQSSLSDQRIESNAAQQDADRSELAWQARWNQLQESVTRLTAVSQRLNTLQKLFEADYSQPQDRFTKTFDSPDGKVAFPTFDLAWTSLSKLWASRPTESAKLYGSVVGVDGLKVTLEPITQLRPQTQQILEIRRVTATGATVLGRVPIVEINPDGVAVNWSASLPPVQLGDAGYWIQTSTDSTP